MQTRILDSISDVPPDEWNSLRGPEANPFLRHEFLYALEASGSASPRAGWHPCHIVLRDDRGQLAGAMPLYQKTNSYGEFVFDFAWANAYHQAGLRYYPKLVSAIPFTPASGPRCLTHTDADSDIVIEQLLAAAVGVGDAVNASSLHILFPEAGELPRMRAADLLVRKDCQFHWHNDGYRDFDQFLEGFTSAKRKKARRERRRVAEAGIHFETLDGNDMTPALWDEIIPLYASTFWQRGRDPYINREFFAQISKTMPDNVVLFIARQNTRTVAVAICFRSAATLYGRYWGSVGYFDSLHFETCYYQGIDYCIREGLQRFEPGTQGEHKIARGFVPVETWSAHWLSHPRFADAVDSYLSHERRHIDRYIDAVRDHVPYRRNQE